MAQHYNPHIVTDGLVLCYDAADIVSYPGGTTWTDLSGNGNAGTLNGSVKHISTHSSHSSPQYSGVHGDGTFIYVSDILGLDEDSGLHVYSVDVSGNLTHIDNDYPDIGNAHAVHTDGNFIYVANDANGLEVYSVNGSGILTHVDNDDQGNNYRDVWGDGTFIYVAAGSGGILSYSVNSSGILTYIDSVAAGWTVGVWGDGNYIYGAGHGSGLFSISVDGSGNLSSVDSDDQGDHALNVWGDGNYIYLANRDGGILSYSVDGSGNLTHVDSHDPGGYANGVWGDGKYIYLAAGSTGLHWYTVDGSGNLTHVDSDDQGSEAKMVWGDSNNIYLANFLNGLEVYKDGLIHNSTNAGTLEFDGTDDMVKISAGFSFNDNNEGTIAAWVKHDGSGNGYIGAFRNNANKWFSLRPGGTYIGIYDYYNGTRAIGSCSTTAVDDSKWHYITRAKTNGTTSDRFYVDGITQSYSITDGALEDKWFDHHDSGTLEFLIAPRWANGAYGGFYDGNIATVHVYSRPLSQSEILQNFNAQRSRFGV